MGVPTAESPPAGLDAYWLGVWRHALKTLKGQGSWAWESRPLLDEYVFALVAARDARLGDEPTRWDKHSKRASALADQLALTDRGRKAIRLKAKEGDVDDDEDPFAELDQLERKRQERAQTA